MTENRPEIHAALQNLPHMAGVTEDSYVTTRLGGLTNLVYRVETDREKLIVRIPGEGTENYIDRAVELHNARAAARAGVSAKVLWADSAGGVMISQYIDKSVTMTPEQFRSRAGAPGRAGSGLRKLHQSGEVFEFRFELFAMIDDYLKILADKNAELPDGYREIVRAAEPVKQALAANPAALAPCHCDPLCENFLDEGSVMWIVDWEYSGMNDPAWDLGDLSVEGEFSDLQDLQMLRAYYGTEPDAAQMGRVVIYKAMCDLLWTLWGLIQHADGNEAEDFWAYATGRFERCKTLMQSNEFAGYLAAIG